MLQELYIPSTISLKRRYSEHSFGQKEMGWFMADLLERQVILKSLKDYNNLDYKSNFFNSI